MFVPAAALCGSAFEVSATEGAEEADETSDTCVKAPRMLIKEKSANAATHSNKI